MTMERSHGESEVQRSPNRSSSPETKEERLLNNTNASLGAAQASGSLSSSQADRNSLLSLAGTSLADIRTNSLRHNALQQMRLAPQGLTAGAPANMESQFHAIGNHQALLADSLRYGRNSIPFHLLLGGQQAPLAATSNPFASSMLPPNMSEHRMLQQLLGTQMRAPASQLQREFNSHASSQRSPNSRPTSFPNTLSDMEQQQLRLMQLQAARNASSPGLPLATANAAGLPAGVGSDFLRLSAMNSLNNQGDMLSGLLPPTRIAGTPAGPTAASLGIPLHGLGAMTPREQQLCQRISDASSPVSQDEGAAALEQMVKAPGAAAQGASPKKRKASSPSSAAKSQRRRRSKDPVVIQGVPHHTERNFVSLGIEEDPNWLSEFQCFVRSQLMEVIQASQSDVLVRSTSKSILPDQVGVRCRYW